MDPFERQMEAMDLTKKNLIFKKDRPFHLEFGIRWIQ